MDENTPALKIQSRSGIFKIQFFQPLYLDIRSLNVNFGAIPTLNKKVVLLIQTEVNSKNFEFRTEIECVSWYKPFK